MDLDFISLILDVDVSGSPGILEITFDRDFFDSVFDGTDDAFIIIADGDEPDFTETSTTTESRTLQIELLLEPMKLKSLELNLEHRKLLKSLR